MGISNWEEGSLEEDNLDEDNLEEENLEEDILEEGILEKSSLEEDNVKEEVKALLDLGDSILLTEDWTNSTVTEQVLEDGSVVKVNRATVYDKQEGGKGFSFVHSIRKTKKGS